MVACGSGSMIIYESVSGQVIWTPTGSGSATLLSTWSRMFPQIIIQHADLRSLILITLCARAVSIVRLYSSPHSGEDKVGGRSRRGRAKEAEPGNLYLSRVQSLSSLPPATPHTFIRGERERYREKETEKCAMNSVKGQSNEIIRPSVFSQTPGSCRLTRQEVLEMFSSKKC